MCDIIHTHFIGGNMGRTRLEDRELSVYTKGEEIFNMVSHIVGATFGLVALVVGIVFSAINGNGYGLASSIVFGISIILLYTMSSIYHGIKSEGIVKKVFQILDHCSIFVLIAGSYTPFALCTIREYSPAFGWTLFGIMWGVAIVGIVLNSIDLKMFKVFSIVCYLLMGWCAVFKIPVLIKGLTIPGFVLVLLGGILYTLGAILYGIGKKRKWMHSLFHICSVLGTVCHIICVLFFVV